MRSRALSLAALALLVSLCGWASAGVRPAAAQALDAGKPPAQIFNGTCAACHRSPRGLVRNVSPGSLPGFLRQHYTTGNDMAGTMATYVLGNGGTDRVAEPPPKREPKEREPKEREPREPRQKARSDAPEVAARPPEAKDHKDKDHKDQAKASRQKAGKKGAEPAAAPPPPAPPEPEKVEAATEAPKAEPVAAEPPKAETAATDCKVEPAKEAADDKSGVAVPVSTPPRQQTSLLTLPGFPAPEPEPEPEPVANPTSGCDPPVTTTAAASRTEEPPKEVAAPKEEPKEAAKDQPPPAAAVAQVARPEPDRPAVAEPPPALDIMQEEVHAARPARVPQQQKKRVQ